MSKADSIGLGLQTNLKTARTSVDFFPPVTGESITMSREELDIEETAGSRAPTSQEYGGRIYEGDIEGAARPDSFPVILAMYMGQPTTSNKVNAWTASTPYVVGDVIRPTTPNGHIYVVTVAGTSGTTQPTWPTTSGSTVTDGTVTWKEANASDGIYGHAFDPLRANKLGYPHPATIISRKDDPADPIVDKYIGAKGNEIAISVEANDYLLYTAGVIAREHQDLDPATSPAPSRDTTRKWAFHQVGAQIRVDGGAAQAIQLENFEMTYNNNLVNDLFVLGSVLVDDIPADNIEVEVTFTPTQAIKSHYQRAMKDSPEDVRLTLTAEGQPIAGAEIFSLTVDLTRLQYVEAPVELDAGETLRSVEVTAMAVLNEETNELLTITVVNDNDGAAYKPPAA